MARLRLGKRVQLFENCFLDAPQFRENCFCAGVMGCDVAPARTGGKHRYHGYNEFPSVVPNDGGSPQASDRN